MSIDQLNLTDLRLGPVTLTAPAMAPRQFDTGVGHLWQWVGNGEPLLSLAVSVRGTRLGTTTGVRHRATWVRDRVASRMDDRTASAEDLPFAYVDGSSGTAGALVFGSRDGLAVRTGVLVSTDGTWMHVVEVTAADTEAGGDLVAAVMDNVRVHPWSPPR